MTEEAFRIKRRQKFLTKRYFKLNSSALTYLMGETLNAIPQRHAGGDLDPFGEGGMFKDSLKLLRLHYTAGEPIESLRPLYAEAMKWFEEWHRAEDTYSAHLAKKSGEDLRLDMTPVEFEDLFHYQLGLDVVSLGILLGEPEAIRRAAALMQSARHTDLLFEGLLAKVIADPDEDTTEFFHEQPYDPLIDAFYTAETPADASAFVKTYLDGWYKSFDGVPWHDGHLVVTDEYSNYEGYWAFEAAAICVLYGIDDSSFRDHIVYPKDLADWARGHKVGETLKPAAGAKAMRLRCEGGEPCPQSGFWSTPAQANSRRAFKSGEVMPEFKDSPWGATVWYWEAGV
jgi:Domain of unknown function (DUF1911)/Domain of unknown function (DUF1910)